MTEPAVCVTSVHLTPFFTDFFVFPSTFFNPIHLFILSFWRSGSPKSFLSLLFFFKPLVSPPTVQTIRWTRSGVSQPMRHQKHTTCKADGCPDTLLYLWGKNTTTEYTFQPFTGSVFLTDHSANLTDLQMAHRTLVGNLHHLWDNGHTFCFWKLTY